MASVQAVQSFSGYPSRMAYPRFGTKTETRRDDADHYTGHRDTSVDEATLPAGKRLCSKMIEWYQRNELFHGKTFDVHLGKHTFRIAPFSFKCQYPEKHPGSPSCSQYTLEAIQKHGVIKGILLGTGRILNCNPVTQHLPGVKNLFIEA